jgi:hypothetical protein
LDRAKAFIQVKAQQVKEAYAPFWQVQQNAKQIRDAFLKDSIEQHLANTRNIDKATAL